MLVLTRKPNESIVIEGGITITVLRVSEGRVQIGIDAPRDVRVDRAEVHKKRQEGGNKEERRRVS